MGWGASRVARGRKAAGKAWWQVEQGQGRGREASGGQGEEPGGWKTKLEVVEGKRGTVTCKQGGGLVGRG